jgi:hypothetical protein
MNGLNKVGAGNGAGVVMALALLVLGAVWVGYRYRTARPPIEVSLLGFTNGIYSFAITNVSPRPIRRWTFEIDSGGATPMIADLSPVTLQPGQGERLEAPGYWLSSWRLAVLSTGPVKAGWNWLLTRTPYVGTNQWELLQFDRSFSPWVSATPGMAPR